MCSFFILFRDQQLAYLLLFAIDDAVMIRPVGQRPGSDLLAEWLSRFGFPRTLEEAKAIAAVQFQMDHPWLSFCQRYPEERAGRVGVYLDESRLGINDVGQIGKQIGAIFLYCLDPVDVLPATGVLVD